MARQGIRANLPSIHLGLLHHYHYHHHQHCLQQRLGDEAGVCGAEGSVEEANTYLLGPLVGVQ